MLEKMEDFFAARLTGYDAHMMEGIIGAKEFYPYTASLLPKKSGAQVLDLGCGTGLELEKYYFLNDSAIITGIDLSAEMLKALRRKFPGKELTLINDSYFDVSLGKGRFDAAVSVESLHHFPASQKLGLYRKLHSALTETGYFILTDYFAESDELEQENFNRLEAMKRSQGLPDGEFYHYDTPLTVAHEISVLQEAGFSTVSILKNWGATYTLQAFY